MKALLAASLLLLVSPALADDAPDPAGRWKTIDDKSGKPRSIVEIRLDEAGALQGTIVQILPLEGQPDDPVCEKCTGALKDKPVKGMVILKGLKPEGGRWTGGTVLDPENGKTYDCFLELQDGGRKLKLRGFVGGPLFGRTQYWLREE